MIVLYARTARFRTLPSLTIPPLPTHARAVAAVQLTQAVKFVNVDRGAQSDSSSMLKPSMPSFFANAIADDNTGAGFAIAWL